MNRGKIERAASGLLATLVLGWLAPSAAAIDAMAGRDLEKTHIAGVPVYYEPVLAPALEALIKAVEAPLAALRASAAEVHAFEARAEPILADLNRLVGYEAEAEGAVDQQAILRAILRVPPVLGLDGEDDEPAPIYLLLQDTIRSHLRDGGTLPGFRYDQATGQVTQTWAWSRRSAPDEPGSESASAVVIAVPDVQQAPEAAAEYVNAFGTVVHELMAPLALHEAVEITLVARLRPTHPHVRWFTDGYADALTVHLLRKHIGDFAVTRFVTARDVEQYADVKREANLLTWPAMTYEMRLPLAAEERLRLARYAFAMHEAVGLIDRHGPGHIGQVLDHVAAGEGRTDRQLLAAVQTVTGENIADRLRAYQPFHDRAEGDARYEAQIEQAIVDSDPEAELHARVRQYEIGRRLTSRSVQRMSRLLRRLDAADAAFEPFDQAIDTAEGRGPAAFVTEVRHAAVIEALRHDTPQAAYDHAEQLLAEHPDAPAALTIRLHRQFTSRDLAKAEATARRLLELEPDPSRRPHQLAQTVLRRIAASRE